MSRYLYFAGGLAAILLIVFAQRVTVVPAANTGYAAAPSGASDVPVEGAAAAIDDLAAWPAATRR